MQLFIGAADECQPLLSRLSQPDPSPARGKGVDGTDPALPGSWFRDSLLEVRLHGLYDQRRVGHVSAVSEDIQNLKSAPLQLLMEVIADRKGCQEIMAMLKYQAGARNGWKVVTDV